MENNENQRNKKKWKEMNKKEKLQALGGYIAIGLIWLVVGVFILFVLKPFNFKLNFALAATVPTVSSNDEYFNSLSEQYSGISNFNALTANLPLGYIYLDEVKESSIINGSGASIGRYYTFEDYTYAQEGQYSAFNPYDLNNLGMSFLGFMIPGTPYPSNSYNVSVFYVYDTMKDGSYLGTFYIALVNSVESAADYSVQYIYEINIRNAVDRTLTDLRSYKSVLTNPNTVLSYFNSGGYDILSSTSYVISQGDTGFIKLPLRNGQISSRKLTYSISIDTNIYSFDYSNTTTASTFLKINIARGVSDSVNFWSIVSGNVIPESTGGVSQTEYNALLSQYNSLSADYSNMVDKYNFALSDSNYWEGLYTSRVDELSKTVSELQTENERLSRELVGFNTLLSQYESAADIEQAIASLRSDISYYQTLNSTLDSQLAVANAEIERLKTANGNLVNDSSNPVYKEIYQTGYDKGKSDGFLQGKEYMTEDKLKEVGAIPSTIVGVVSAPVNFFREVLNFSILGINLFNFICSIITLVLVSKIIKVVL